MDNGKEQEKKIQENIRSWAEEYAVENNWVLNSDETQLNAVIRGLARNKIRHGERYCPCRIRSGDPNIDREIICPCIYHKDEVKNDGNCHCYLFFNNGK